MQAAVLRVMLEDIEEIIEKRRIIAGIYHAGFSGIKGLTLPTGPDEQGNYFDVFQNYVVRTTMRDDLVQNLKEHGVGTLISWAVPSHHQPNLGLKHFKLPVTEAVSKEVISLPMHPGLTSEDAEYVVKAVQSFYV